VYRIAENRATYSALHCLASTARLHYGLSEVTGGDLDSTGLPKRTSHVVVGQLAT